jgi:hypothetical protein
LPQDHSLAEILELILKRESLLSRNGVALGIGMQMIQAARKVVRLQSVESLLAFEVLEDEWRTLQPKARLRYANQFRFAFDVSPKAKQKFLGNTPYNSDWNPARGFVYGFWSKDHFGLVKLGATTQHPTERMQGFNRKYGLEHLGIVFFFEVTLPALVERHWTRYLVDRRRSVGHEGSKEWYEFNPGDALQQVQASIEATGVKRLDTKYVLKGIAVRTEIDFWPLGPKRFPAYVISKE